ncbi:hypothetical protein D3C77_346120 [compost metagenome]
MFGQGCVQRLSHRCHVVFGIHKDGRGRQLADETLDLSDAIGQPTDHDCGVCGVLQERGRYAATVHMCGQADVLLGAADGADHGASQIVQLLALPVGDGDLLDVEVGKDPLHFVGGARTPGGQALVEVAAGKERAQPWMSQGGHAGQLDRRKVGRFIHQDLVAVVPQDGLECRPSGAVDIPQDIRPADQVACGAQDGEQHNVQFERMDIAGLEAFVAIPAPGLLAFASERTVALRNAVEIALDRVHEAPGAGLHQQTRTHFGAVGFRQAALCQPLDDLAVARRLADRALGCGSPSLGAYRLHVGVEGSSAAGARCRAVFFLIGIKLVLFVGIGGLGLLQAIDEARQLIQERPIAIELEVERGFDLAVRGFFQAGDERLYLGELGCQRSEGGRQRTIARLRQDAVQPLAQALDFWHLGFAEHVDRFMQLLHVGVALPCVEIVEQLNRAIQCLCTQARQVVLQDKGATTCRGSKHAESVSGQLSSVVLPSSDA